MRLPGPWLTVKAIELAKRIAGEGISTIIYTDIARDGTLVGAGFSMDWGQGLTAKFDYAGDFRSHFQDNSYNATVRYKF